MVAISRRSTWIILAAILLLAAFLRFWHLDGLPPGLYHDEAYNGLDALSLLAGKTFPQFYEGWELYAADAHAQRPPSETRWPVFFEGNYGREPLHVYLMALSTYLFGATPFAIRAVPAAAGVLAILTTFLAARALLRYSGDQSSATAVALLAAFFLAILYPALHFSRFGIRAMLLVPVETMAVACFWWGVNRARRNWPNPDERAWLFFAAAGFFLGLSIYTFAASRLLPLVWLMFVPLWFWFDREALAAHWRHALIMAGAALLTALPLLLFFARYPYYFVFRIAYVANKGKGAVDGRPWETWLLNVGRVGRGLFWQGETHLRHNLPGRPYLDPAQAVLFVIGFVRGILYIRNARYLFLLIWFGVMLLPSILSGDAPHFGRLSGAAAPAAILIGLGTAWLWQTLSTWLARYLPAQRARRLATGALALALVFSAYLTVRDYFGRYASHPDLANDFYLADWQLGRYAATAVPEDARLFLAPTQEELATIYYALGDPARLRNYGDSAHVLPAGTPGLETLYLLRPDATNAADAVTGYFPRAETESSGDNFVAYHVAADTPRMQRQNESNFVFGDQIELAGWSAAREGDTLDVALFWRALAEMDRDADGNLLAQVDRQPEAYPTSDWVPGEIVVARFAIPWPEGAAAGEASLRTGLYYLPTLEPLGEAVALTGPGALP